MQAVTGHHTARHARLAKRGDTRGEASAERQARRLIPRGKCGEASAPRLARRQVRLGKRRQAQQQRGGKQARR
jgi:hypothetical protein